MRQFLLLILFVPFFLNAAQQQVKMVYSQQGYPWKDLIRVSDSVKIFYTENQGKIHCRVSVTEAQHQWQSKGVETSEKAFTHQPLRSCLPRAVAKQQLAAHYRREAE